MWVQVHFDFPFGIVSVQAGGDVKRQKKDWFAWRLPEGRSQARHVQNAHKRMMHLLTDHLQRIASPEEDPEVAGCSRKILLHGAHQGPAAMPGDAYTAGHSLEEPVRSRHACGGGDVAQAAGEAYLCADGYRSVLQRGYTGSHTEDGAGVATGVPAAAVATATVAAGGARTADRRPASVTGFGNSNTTKIGSLQLKADRWAEAAAAGSVEGAVKRRRLASQRRGPPAAADAGEVGCAGYAAGLPVADTEHGCQVFVVE